MRSIDLEKDPYLKQLMYAVAGGGKTSLYGTVLDVPELLPCCWIDAGGQPVALKRFRQHPNWKKLTLIELEKLSDLSAIHRWFKQGQPSKDRLMVDEVGLTPGYKSVVFDGISHFQQLSFQRVMSTEETGLGETTRKPEWQDYGSVLEQMIRFAMGMWSLPLHVMVTALEREERDKEGVGKPTVKPGLRGQAVEYIPSYCNLMGRLQHRERLDKNVASQLKGKLDKDTYNIAFFKATEHRWGKDQYGIGTTYIIDPTMREIYDRVFNLEAFRANARKAAIQRPAA